MRLFAGAKRRYNAPMLRWLFNLLTILSLLLCVTTPVFWVHGCTTGDTLTWCHSPWQVDIYSTEGLLFIGGGELTSKKYASPEGWTGSFWPFQPDSHHFSIAGGAWRGTWYGFHAEWVSRHSVAITHRSVGVTVPCWFLMLVSASVVAFGVAHIRRRCQREKLGHCHTCGYDLRAHKPGERCPECGAVIANTRTELTPKGEGL